VIESLTIENLRGIKKLSISGLTNVNIFVGKNGAGKSTILEAIFLASTFFNKEDTLRGKNKLDYIVKRRAGRGNWQNSRDILWYARNTSEDITIELRFRTGNSLKFKVPYAGEIILQIPSEEKAAGKATWLKPDNYMDVARSLGLEKETVYLREVVFLDSRLSVYDIERRVWRYLLDKRLDKLVVDLVRDEYEPRTESITYKPGISGFVLSILLPHTSVEIDGLGDGARNALLYASILALVSDTGVLIEDPEVHQHPGGLLTLLKFTLKMAKERNLQLFITTHSLELVSIARELCNKYGLDVKVFYIERDHETGLVDVRTIDRVDLEVLEKMGLDPRLLHVL
jgi:predicted ATPase